MGDTKAEQVTAPRLPDEDAAAPVLVVDDDHAVRTLFVSVLRAAGVHAIAAATGEDALDVLDERKISAMLLDSNLPDAGVDALLARVRDRDHARTLPVIVVTDESDVADRVTALDAGADDYLTKPVHVQELVARVRAQLRGQAEWLGMLGDRMRERTEVLTALTRDRPSHSPTGTAEHICSRLGQLPGLDGVGVYAFIGDGATIPLALHGTYGPQIRAGRPLPAALATRLRDRAAAGPWSERARPAAGGTTVSPHPLGSRGETAWAPLRSRGDLIGLLAVTGSDSGGDVFGRSLSLAIDVSAVAAALLAPALESWSQSETLRGTITRVIDQRAFSTVFQPIVDLATMRVVGHEALTRFHDGTSPELRFAEAAEVGLAVALEVASIERALASLRTVPRVGMVSVNVSPLVLVAAPELREVLGRADRAVVLELTEHDRIDDYPRVREAVAALGPQVRLSVDDAGSGYACLTHVLALRPAFTKLDRGWVQGIEADPTRQALVAGLQHFAQRAGCRLIAEGIETPGQLDVLRELGVAFGQGYLLGAPQPAPADELVRPAT